MIRRKWILALPIALVLAASIIPASGGAAKKPVTKVKPGAVCPKPVPKAKAKQAPAKKADPKNAEKPLPKLLDLGSDKCIPCKMMIPVLDELTKEYKGKLEVEFIDVWKDRSAGEKYKIQSIPTQIFLDAKGKELFRHVGFYPKADIIAKFKELGIKLTK